MTGLGRAASAAGLALAGLACIAAPAVGSTASDAGNVLQVQGDAAEFNGIEVGVYGGADPHPGAIYVSDAGGMSLTGTPGSCQQSVGDGPNRVHCNPAALVKVVINGGDAGNQLVITDAVPAGTAPNEISGGNSADTLIGGDDADVLDGGLGPDDMGGNGGFDTVTYASRSSSVNVTVGNGNNDDGGVAGEDGPSGGRDKVIPGVEMVIGGTAADSLTGDGGDNSFDGGLGPDEFHGGLGVDTVSYESRTTRVSVSIGNGIADDGGLAGEDGAGGTRDSVGSDVENAIGGNGVDLLTGGSGDNVLDGGPGSASDVIDGGSGGTDTVSYAKHQPSGMVVQIGNGQYSQEDVVRPNIENLIGASGPFASVLSGDEDANVISCLCSGDGTQIWGGAGADTLIGTPGGDVITGGTGVDTINAGAGNDTVNLFNTPGEAEHVDCGPGGLDAVKLDVSDTVGAGQVELTDCEIQSIGSAATTPLTVTITSGPSGSTTDAAPTFGFTPPGDDAGDMVVVECRVDSQPFDFCASPTTVPAQSPGTHTFEVRATDIEGEVDNDTRSFTVESPATPPTTTGRRAAALKKCKKKKTAAARKKCKKKAKRLPL